MSAFHLKICFHILRICCDNCVISKMKEGSLSIFSSHFSVVASCINKQYYGYVTHGPKHGRNVSALNLCQLSEFGQSGSS